MILQLYTLILTRFYVHNSDIDYNEVETLEQRYFIL